MQAAHSSPGRPSLALSASERQSVRVLTIIPTYNEIESLPRTVARLRAAVPEADILVVDDSSPDGTGEWADDMAARDERIHVMHRAGKEGLGAAYIAGFRYALENGYDVIVEHDADGSHQPEQLPRLLKAVEDGADLAIGSRWVPGGKIVNWPLSRKLISRGGSFYSRVMLGMPLRDITAGYRAYRREALEALDFSSIESVGYGFQVDMTFRMHKLGMKIVEVPITFIERELGTSKMSGDIVREAMVNVTRWGAGERLAQAKRLGQGLSQRVRESRRR